MSTGSVVVDLSGRELDRCKSEVGRWFGGCDGKCDSLRVLASDLFGYSQLFWNSLLGCPNGGLIDIRSHSLKFYPEKRGFRIEYISIYIARIDL